MHVDHVSPYVIVAHTGDIAVLDGALVGVVRLVGKVLLEVADGIELRLLLRTGANRTLELAGGFVTKFVLAMRPNRIGFTTCWRC